MLTHDTSSEEARYLAEVSKERSAFEHLIRARQHMAVPAEQDGRAVAFAASAAATASAALGAPPGILGIPGAPPPPGSSPGGALVSTRKAGGRGAGGGAPAASLIVVDVREFMSPLPCVLHAAGFTLVPITLEVGDYVLSPHICVERKALPDLISSLSSGRLFHQAEAMCRAYATPALLIEFDADKHFGLSVPSEISEDVAPNAPMSKLALLLLHFPKLRVLWSRSVHATAALFKELKEKAEQPSAAAAAAAGVGAGDDAEPGGPALQPGGEAPVFNEAAVDFARRLPGVGERGAKPLLRSLGSLAAVARASEAQLAHALGGDAQGAATLRAFLHAPFPAFQG